MYHIFLIGIGGFAGAISRYLVSKYLNNVMPQFPLGTLTVNVAGTFVLGFIMYSITQGKIMAPEMRDMITIGFIGALTTMSAFSYETFRLAELNEMFYATLNLVLNIVLCIGSVYTAKTLTSIIYK
jgi:CrcB protein